MPGSTKMSNQYKPPVTPVTLTEADPDGGYQEWCTNREYRAPGKYPLRHHSHLLFSIIVPVFNPEDHWLQECIDSVRGQFFADWELILVDDGSRKPTLEILENNQARDNRIKVHLQSTQSGISQATNQGVTLAQGDFLVFLDHDDLLDPYALPAFAQRLAEKPATDVLYSDEDRFDENYLRIHPGFKPQFSLEKLLCTNYIHHPVVMRRSFFKEIGGLNSQYDGSQDYDLILRAAEKTTKIEHIPDVLYHMRIHSGSLSSGPEAKPAAHGQGVAAVQAYLDRQKSDAIITPTVFAGYHNLTYPISPRPKVSLLLLVNSDISREETLHHWQQNEDDEILICSNIDKTLPVRFNELAHKAHGDVFIFADGSLQPEPGCIDELVAHSIRNNIGLVTGKITYNDKKLHSCGLTLGIKACSGRWHYACSGDDIGYGGWVGINHEVSATPWQLMAVKKDLFSKAGLFNSQYRDHGFDIHLALQLRESNSLKHLAVANAKAIFPCTCPGKPDQWQEQDFLLLWADWKKYLNQDDPFFHPHFSTYDESISFIRTAEMILKKNGLFTAYDKTTVQLLWQCTNQLAAS